MRRPRTSYGNRGLCGGRPTQAEINELQERIRLAREEPEKIFPPELVNGRRVTQRHDIPQEPGLRVISESDVQAASQDSTSEGI